MRSFLTNKRISIVCILSIVLLFVTSSIILNGFHSVPSTLDQENLINFSSDWKVSVGDSAPVVMNLPTKIKNPNNETITLEKQLPDKLDSSYNFSFLTSEQYATVHYNEFLGYCYKCPNTSGVGGLSGKNWHLVSLNGADQGENIIITLQSPYKAYSGLIPAVYLGTKTSLLFNILRHIMFPFIIGVTVSIVGFVLICLSLLLRSSRSETDTAFFGIFCILCGVWISTESSMFQFILGNTPLIDFFNFLSLASIPCAFCFYLQSTYPYKELMSFKFFSILSVINLWTIFLFQILGKADFTETVIFTKLLIAIIFIYSFVFEVKSYIANRRFMGLKVTVLGQLVFILCSFFGFVVYHNNPNFHWNALVVCIGMIVFIFCLLFDSSVKFYNIKKITHRNQFLEELAFVDVLTGLYNRTAYSEALKNKYDINLHEFDSIGIFIADINNLKDINDTYGHEEGDIAIYKAGQIIKKTFGNYGTAYRVGGDEFCIICENITREKCIDLLNRFRIETNNVNDFSENTSLFPVELSLGYAFHDALEQKIYSLTELLKRADNAMYANKVNFQSKYQGAKVAEFTKSTIVTKRIE